MVASFTKPDQSSGWDENGQLLCLRYLKNGNHFHRFEYTLDDSGNRISQIDTPENLAAQVTWSYGYDWLNRLTSVSKNGQTTSLYAYDESDNRVQLSLPQANEVWAYTYDVADRILSRSLDLGSGPNLYETFQHDDDGNLTERTLVSTNDTKVYRWDADNRLRDITHDVQWMTAQYEFTGIRRQAYQNGDPQSSRYHTSGGLP